MKDEARGALARADETLTHGRAARSELAIRGEELVGRAVALKERIARDFWDLGRLLATMRREAVHVALGFERFEDLLGQRLGLSRSVAWKLMTVAEQLPRAEASQVGQEKAYALVVYARATQEEAGPAALIQRDAEVAGRPISALSLRELRAAARDAKQRRPSTLRQKQVAAERRELLAGVRAQLGALGIARSAVGVDGQHIVVRLSPSQARRLAKR